MSSPIKPPSRAALPLDVGTVDALARGRSTQGAADVGRAAEAQESALVAELRAGAISKEAFVEGLVRAELEKPFVRALGDGARAEIERALRDAIAHDPGIVGLLADLEHSR